ncbi:acidic leucine-rich nuclear phosphoprotein 32 family member B-like [Gossypium australe]|uniref:Acidic leucine-rich nuclear phosphoprotein 32 family member B-like n=1 Tax=Gossypium australe TaxID=47621 RepID=A0A5B6VU58_9ROSI|nr:acidic leucine-rich nuclear phosphoprotein 32 family member B-like [Gossypium australe]
MSRCRKTKISEKVNINASCSAIISRQVPQKLEDPRCFTIPIKIWSIHFNRALYDLRVTINLIPLSIFEKFGFIIPKDFIVLDFEEDREIPILLGKPSLATSLT